MLDQQGMSALVAALQQAMQILQTAMSGQSGDAAGMAGMGNGASPPPPPGEEGDDMGGMGDMDDDDDMGMGGEDDTGGMDGEGGDSLHDRVQKLEGHTGLTKSASATTPLTLRLDRLESSILGQEFEGPAIERVRQLEKSLGIHPGRRRSSTTVDSSPAAPDVIRLDDLIKTAVQTGIEQGLKQMNGGGNTRQQGDLPSPSQLRKNAATARRDSYSDRRSSRPREQNEDSLVKTALNWADEDMDQEVTFGDALQLQYVMAMQGIVPADDDD